MRFTLNSICVSAHLLLATLALGKAPLAAQKFSGELRHPEKTIELGGLSCVFKPKSPVVHIPLHSGMDQCPGTFNVLVTQQDGKDYLDCYASEQDYYDFMESGCNTLAVSFSVK